MYSLLYFSGFVEIGLIVDLIFDAVYQTKTDLHEIVQLVTLIITSIVFVVVAAKCFSRNKFTKNNISNLRLNILEAKENYDALRKGCSQNILLQYEEWKLTSSEKKVASLLIMGECIKNIARIRSLSQNTIKEQASSIYRKARLNERYELSAYIMNNIIDKSLLGDHID
jgi:DNA-binding NarL/FixJ family response regulator